MIKFIVEHSKIGEGYQRHILELIHPKNGRARNIS